VKIELTWLSTVGTKMSQPMSRDAMRELKANTEEAARIQQVKNIVYQVYRAAVETAKSKTDTSYYYRLPLQNRHQPDLFYVKNMPEILAGLQELFPGCDVSQTQFSMGADGKMYDISKIDEKVLPFVNRAGVQSCIVIDWS
jgi:hypothetical protein